MSGRGKGPLAGVTVLDLTAVFMGPYATQIMADLGAAVVKIEGPAGDTTRHLPSGPDPARGGTFLNLNRGKRSLGLDLKRAEARALLLRLAARADVLVHSMRHAAIDRLGLAYDALAAVNPRLVYANLYGFSRTGPYRDYPAYDDIIQAASGFAHLQSRLSGGVPTYFATIMADKVSGLTGAYAIMAALYAREKTGRGQEVEVPMFETLVSFSAVEHLNGALFDPPQGPPEYVRVISPDRRPYRTADGYIGMMVYTDRQWQGLFAALGHPDWSKDPMFDNLRARTENVGAVLGRLAAVVETRTTAEWLDLLRTAEIPAMRIAEPSDLLRDEHLTETGFWVARETDVGALRFPGIPTRFSDTPGEIGDPGPALGADSRDILSEAGVDESEISRLIESGAVIAADG